MSSVTKKRPKPRVRNSTHPLQLLPREPSVALFPSKNELLKLFSVVVIAASVAGSCNYAVYFFNRQAKPFCESIDESYDPSADLCEPCPGNGWCSSGKLECFPGYKKHGRNCIEDGIINQTTRELSELLEQHVCDAYGQVLCNEPGRIWFQESDMMEIIEHHLPKNSINMNDDTSTFVKNKVMETVESILETKASYNRIKEFKCPDFLAELHKPLGCRVRQWIYKHLGIMAATLGLLVGLTKFILSIRHKSKLTTRAEQLYEQICEILQENAMRTRSGDNEGEPWVVASWLRDQLLLPRERKHTTLWKKVEELILEDSRIDQYPKLIKGESKVVLEWQVDGLLAEMLKKKFAMKAKAISNLGISSYASDGKKPQIAES
ncbi:hypothetical protein Cni_G07487 [Canna indica]|uniref:Man1/Src1-like C-terminal domain-containing protein n=1 Tax=Canna indica TaxID=4628 RepID=A0AAQ3Q4X5_9LILI|nr:hypothetical protein Cni_G07487 [Canna indica]